MAKKINRTDESGTLNLTNLFELMASSAQDDKIYYTFTDDTKKNKKIREMAKRDLQNYKNK